MFRRPWLRGLRDLDQRELTHCLGGYSGAGLQKTPHLTTVAFANDISKAHAIRNRSMT